MDTVDTVVAGHDCFRCCFTDTNLKATQIDLPQGSFRHSTVLFETVGFLVVAGKVLDGNGCSGNLLYTDSISGSNLAGNERIF